MITVDFAAGDDKTLIAFYKDGKFQGAFDGMKPLMGEMKNLYRTVYPGLFIEKRSANSRLLVSRNKREGLYIGKWNGCRERAGEGMPRYHWAALRNSKLKFHTLFEEDDIEPDWTGRAFP